MGFFDGWDWDKIVNGFAASVPAMVTSYVGARGVADANRNASDIAERTRQANIAETTAANERAAGYLQPVADQTIPATAYLRTVMARNPYEFTPQQETEQADRLRLATRAMPAAFRGSGRATSAVLNDVANRGRAATIAENQRRSDTAAGTLAGTGGAASGNLANLSARGGAQVADINTGAATDQANALTSTAQSNNAALANITSYFANAVKDADRESRYGKTKATLEGV